MTKEEAHAWLIEHYFAAWEIEYARKSSDPIEFLRRQAVAGRRGQWTDTIRLDSVGGKVRAWPGDSPTSHPTVPLIAIRYEELARQVLAGAGVQMSLLEVVSSDTSASESQTLRER